MFLNRRGSLLGSALLLSFLFGTLLVLFVERDVRAPAIQLKATDMQFCLLDEDGQDSTAGMGSAAAPMESAIEKPPFPDTHYTHSQSSSVRLDPLSRPEARAPPLRF